jgi:hypothetical protein
MSDREDRPASDETIAFSGRGGGPPTATQPIYMPGEQPPGRGRQFLIYLLLLLLGLAGGFVAAQFITPSDDEVPDEDLVFYEHASTTFPIEGAQFTASTFDETDRTCDKELLKRYLRADQRRLAAWLDIQEVQEADLDRFIDSLETRILDKPTPVTNYGCFGEGDGPCPFSIQSVLGPGTPVWFDPNASRIVAKCACSNPIRTPKCPPNCEDIPTPTPTPSPTPTPTIQRTPTPTLPPTPPPTQPPTPSPTPPPTASPTQPPRTQPPIG